MEPRSRIALAAALLTVAGLPARAPAADVAGTTCEVFPADNAWHLDVSNLPLHPKNDVWKRRTHAQHTMLHPDFGPPSYGIPFDVVGAGHEDVSIDFTYDDESDPGPYPFGPDVTIEGGSDRHANMIDLSDCTLFELFAAQWNGGNPKAGSGAIFHLEGPKANELRPAGWTSADAAGLSVFAGLIRHDEIDAGVVDHAIRFTVGCTSDHYLWPARHSTNTGAPSCPPMGARFRLKAGFDMSGYSPRARVVLRAMQTYGLIVADNGSDWYFQGTVDDRWTYAFVDQLKQIPAMAFQAVDARGCKVSPNSAEFAYGPECPVP